MSQLTNRYVYFFDESDRIVKQELFINPIFSADYDYVTKEAEKWAKTRMASVYGAVRFEVRMI